MKGSPVVMECKVIGSPVIQMKWFKNDTEISSNDNKYQMGFNDSVATLEIANSVVDDSGEYVCEASSEAGSDRCKSVIAIKGL